MTSPVDTSVKWFRNTMPGAPPLRGQAGSLISLLDACLVDGWGSQTASSVVIAGGVATATFPSDHAAGLEAVVLVAGASTPAGLNGEQKVTVVAPNVIKWATAEADGTATGTITVKMAPAGWTKVYTGTNLAVYKSADPQAHGQYLRVNDTGTTVARVLGYENMTGVSTGTGPFPTNAQASGGFNWGKSYSAGATDVPWSIVADSRAFYLNAASAAILDPAYSSGGGYFFGDLLPHSQAGDAFATLVTGGSPVGDWTSYGGHYILTGSDVTSTAMPRRYDGVGTAIQPFVRPYITTSVGALPNFVNGRIVFSPLAASDANTQLTYRADLPGGVLSRHFGLEKLLAPNQLFTDNGGRARAIMHVSGSFFDASNFYGLGVDVTGPWR